MYQSEWANRPIFSSPSNKKSCFTVFWQDFVDLAQTNEHLDAAWSWAGRPNDVEADYEEEDEEELEFVSEIKWD